MFRQIGVGAAGRQQVRIAAVAKADLGRKANLDRGIGAIDQQQSANRGGEAGYR